MDEKQQRLTIEQVMGILDMSYPTARNFAVRYGELTGNKWHIPSDAVWNEIWRYQTKADEMKNSFFVAMPEMREKVHEPA